MTDDQREQIGLLKPAKYTESRYSLYDDAALERLQQILLFRKRVREKFNESYCQIIFFMLF